MDFNTISLDQALGVLGQILADTEQHYEVVAIGGGSLLLMGQLFRMTKDLDLVALLEEDELISANPLPKGLLQAISEVALALGLGSEWLNAGPAALLDMGLPEGFRDRMQMRKYGGLTLYLSSRFDQICFKLYASIDQGPRSKHFADLKNLEPTQEELQKASLWCLTQDVSEEFADTLEKALMTLRGLNGHSK